MKCACGYFGIPTIHAEPRHWKCPECHTPVPLPLQHDPVDEGDKFVCSQCGMHGAKPEDLHTPCPGHGAHWNLPVYSCTCGEWAFAPKPPQRTLVCKRCGVEYPEYLRADYVPPPPTGKRAGLSPKDYEFIQKLRTLFEDKIDSLIEKAGGDPKEFREGE